MIYNAHRTCITHACADFSDSQWSGKSYVYVWLDENRRPFYVGSGSGNRASSTSRRSEVFLKKLNDFCSIWFVAENVHPRFVFDIGRYTIVKLVDNGFLLCQKAYTNPRSKYGNVIPEKFIEQKCGWIYGEIESCRGRDEWVKGQHEPILEEDNQ